MEGTRDQTIRPIIPTDEPFLWEMLYQAIYLPQGSPPLPRDIVRHPDLSRYVEGWGQPDDMGFIALDGTAGDPIGATWLRLLTGANRGYGYVDETTPELTIAVLPAYRNQGVGSRLLAELMAASQSRFPAICLSVSVGNRAFGLYQRLGFSVVKTSAESVTMRYSWGML